MAIAQLSIDIEARLANFERDLKRASDQADAMANKLSDAFKGVGMAAAGLAGVGSFAIFKAKIDDAISSMAGLKDAAERTGASVENLSGLKGIAKIGGTDFELVQTALDKMNKALHSTDDESKGAGKALAALGLSVRELRDLDPAQALQKIAEAQANFAEGGGKAAAMMAIFGKSGADMTKYLNDLADAGKLVGKVTTDQAKAADDYEKNVARLQASWGNLSKTMAAAVVGPAKDITDWMVRAQKEGGALKAVLVGIGAAMASAVGMDINPIASAESNASEQFKKLMQLRNTLAIEQKNNTDPKGLDALLGGSISSRRIAQLQEEIKETEKALKSAIVQKNKFLSKDSADNAPKSTELNSQTFGAPAPKSKTPDAHANDFTSLMQSLKEKIAVQEADLATTEKLNEAQKFYAKYQADISIGAIKLTEDQKKLAESTLEIYLARTKENETDKANQKAGTMVADYKRGNEIILERIQREGELMLMNQRQYAIAQALYKVEDDGRAIRERILRDIQDETAQKKALADAEAELAVQREKVSAATAKSYDEQHTFQFGWAKAFQAYASNATDAAATAQSAFNSLTMTLEDSLYNFATNTKFTFKDMAKSIIDSLARVAAKQAAMGLINLGSSLVSNWMNGGATTSGPSSAAGGGSWLGDTSSYKLSGARANGGDVGAGKTYLVGERGPELLRMGSRSGTVIPNEAIGGGISIQQYFSITSSGSSEQGGSSSGGASFKQFADRINGAVRQVIVDEMRSGGLLEKARAA